MYMKRIIINSLMVLVFARQVVHAQGTTYLSNLSPPPTGSLVVGSDSWLAIPFITGNNMGGYVLNSVQLGMADASGNPSGFTVMVYEPIIPVFGNIPGSGLAALNGYTDPAAGNIYTYTPTANLTLAPNYVYFIVLTAGTAIANGSYEWSLASTSSYNQNDHWAAGNYAGVGVVSISRDGSSWNNVFSTFPQYAINATAIPEPSAFSFLFLGSWVLIYARRIKKHSRT
jgi:hypothetical protein